MSFNSINQIYRLRPGHKGYWEYYPADRFGKLDALRVDENDVFIVIEKAIVVSIYDKKPEEFIVLSKHGLKRIEKGLLAECEMTWL